MTATENAAVVRRLLEEAWNQGQLEIVAECLADDAVFHLPAGEGVVPFGPEVQMAVIVAWRHAFPDLLHSVEDLLVDGDRVVANVPLTGTHTGVLTLGAEPIQPTGRSIHVREILICRIASGKIVEMWGTFDRLAVLEQLGAIPIAAPEASGSQF